MNPVREMIKTAVKRMIKAWWPALQFLRRKTSQKRILFIVYNDMIASYSRPVYDLLRDDPRLIFAMTSPPVIDFRTTAKRLAASMGIPHIDFPLACLQWWDLIIMADLSSKGFFHPAIPKIHLSHGISQGKMQGGEWRAYGREAKDDQGRPRYARMFEASHYIRKLAIAYDPVFEPCIAVIGDLRSDHMLSLQVERSAIRQGLGFKPNDLVVLIQSTWNTGAVMETFGHPLLEQAKKLAEAGRYKFILSTHPKHWEGDYAIKQPWGSLLLEYESPNIIVIKPGQKWEPFHIAADIALTDHSSLTMTFSLLHKPLIFAPIPSGEVHLTSNLWRLYEISPKLERADDLGEVLDQAIENYPLDKLKDITPDINSYPGRAEERLRQEIYLVLQLSNPAEA